METKYSKFSQLSIFVHRTFCLNEIWAFLLWILNVTCYQHLSCLPRVHWLCIIRCEIWFFTNFLLQHIKCFSVFPPRVVPPTLSNDTLSGFSNKTIVFLLMPPTLVQCWKESHEIMHDSNEKQASKDIYVVN